MAELVVSELQVHELSAQALVVLKFALAYAQKNRLAELHTLPIDVFCCSAGLPMLSTDELSVLLKEACNASVVIETIDTISRLCCTNRPVQRSNVGAG